MFQTSNRKLVDGLDVNGEVLDRIHEDFKKRLSDGRIKIHSFHESKGMSGFQGIHEKVRSCTLFFHLSSLYLRSIVKLIIQGRK
jgi:hypothetical protein